MRTTTVENPPSQGSVRLTSKAVGQSRLFFLFVVVITFFVLAVLTLNGLRARRVDAAAIISGTGDQSSRRPHHCPGTIRS